MIRWIGIPSSPFYRVRLEVSEDGLAADNEAWAVADNTEGTEILWVGPDNFFLEKALQLEKSLQVVRLGPLIREKQILLTNRDRKVFRKTAEKRESLAPGSQFRKFCHKSGP